ncbi:hypothetical protein HPP92_003409 [Vanilla planifolia]|uniref:Peptidase A1 domain-containing protein n=1 Tax=Vanilla planifolia TaxID=51239 RepID=A0A835RXK5_VANPL|nr:hypothetical protein HPP92_003409 [Vanilla planifolia]
MASPCITISLLFLILLTVIISTTCNFTVDLIHRDSINSPLHNPQSTPRALLRAAVERSLSRSRYFSRATLQSNIHSNVIPNTFEYLMSFYIGTPAKNILAIVDTGSDLIWLQCKPCYSCYKQRLPLFDPALSTTYKSVSCESDSCSALPSHDCGSTSQCRYEYSYGDQSYVVGYLATESLGFDSGNSSRLEEVRKVLFGCTHESNGTFDAAGAGLVGLGGGQLSLVAQLGDAIGHKFSYCLPPIDNNSSNGRLKFGSQAVNTDPNAVSTSIITGTPDTFFFLNLESIRVGNETEAIAVKPAQVGSHGGNIIIDSGTTLTFIDDESLQSLISRLTNSVKMPQVSDPDGLFTLCFEDSDGVESAQSKLPDITFHFSGADVVLKPSNMFVKIDEKILCLGLLSSEGMDSEIGIFGNIAQQNFNIAYDLDAKTLTLAPADCTKV